MLHLLPRPTQTPDLEALLGDLGDPSPGVLARALGVSARTVARWRAAGEAPRPVLLALFWVTRWGRSALDCDLANSAALYYALAESRRHQVDALKRRLERAEAAAHGGAANAPSFDPLAPDPAPRSRAGSRYPTAV